MFDEVKTLAENAMSGKVDPQALEQAATDHVGSMDQGEIADHLQTAAQNLQNQGQPDLAQQAMGLVSQLQSSPGGAKDAVVSFITNNPQVLQHFAPSFAQGILSRL
ncbi:MAG: hypothetical protein JO233_08660 [Candidatus Eremiobacteraeota bacterium]|nr:hypothetical protein [Candidatus Eremiobacteraeota bacterium]